MQCDWLCSRMPEAVLLPQQAQHHACLLCLLSHQNRPGAQRCTDESSQEPSGTCFDLYTHPQIFSAAWLARADPAHPAFALTAMAPAVHRYANPVYDQGPAMAYTRVYAPSSHDGDLPDLSDSPQLPSPGSPERFELPEPALCESPELKGKTSLARSADLGSSADLTTSSATRRVLFASRPHSYWCPVHTPSYEQPASPDSPVRVPLADPEMCESPDLKGTGKRTVGRGTPAAFSHYDISAAAADITNSLAHTTSAELLPLAAPSTAPPTGKKHRGVNGFFKKLARQARRLCPTCCRPCVMA